MNIKQNSVVEKKIVSDQKVRLVAKGSPTDISLVPALLLSFKECIEQNFAEFIIDLQFIHELSPSFIVSLLEMTLGARRRGGKLVLVNVNAELYEQLNTFRPTDFLDIEISEGQPTADKPLDKRKKSEPVKTEAEQDPDRENEPVVRKEISIASRVDRIYQACDFVLDIAKNMGFPPGELSKIKIAVYEACLNVIEHVFHSDPSQHIPVTVENTTDTLRIFVHDQGGGFEVTDQGRFDVVEMVSNRETGGMGLHIISRSMDEVKYQQDKSKGNCLIMVKKLKKRVERRV
jgi:serine/threonine-protein kinase RsbW